MDLVFRFARRITVLVQGTVLVEGPPDEIAARPAGAPGLPRRAGPCLALLEGARRLRRHGRARGRRARARRARRARGARPQRRRQDDAARDHHGPHHLSLRDDDVQRRIRSRTARVTSGRSSGSATCRRSARSFRRSRSRRTCWSPRARDAGTSAGLRALSRGSRNESRARQPALRRRAADARDRARADGEPVAPPDGRAARGDSRRSSSRRC